MTKSLNNLLVHTYKSWLNLGSMFFNAEQHVKLDSEQEYLTRAEVYISNAASMTLRKVNKYYWLQG